MQLRSGWRPSKEDVEASICDRLEKVCQFFWRLDGIWSQKANTTPVSRVDSLASDMMSDASPRPLAGPSQTASRNSSQPESVLSGVSPRPRSSEFPDNNNSDQESSTMQLGSQYRSTRRTRGGHGRGEWRATDSKVRLSYHGTKFDRDVPGSSVSST